MLGRPVGRHVGKFDISDGVGVIAASLIPLALGIAGVVGTIEALVNETELTIVNVAVTALLLLVGSAIVALVVRRMLRKAKQTVDVFEGGLLWRFGGTEQVIAWPSVSAARWVTIVRANNTVKGYRLSLMLQDGKTVSLDQWIPDLPVLKEHVARFVRFV